MIKYILLVGSLLGGLLGGQAQAPAKDIEYDTVKVLVHIYFLSLPGNPVCNSYLVKAWEVRAWYEDPLEPGEMCINCQPYAHHHEYLEMNKKRELTDWVFESKQVNWL